MRKGKVFNTLRRPKLLRREIPAGERAVGALLLVALAGMAVWLVAQRDRYDPGDRDISMEVLEAQSVEDTLYKAPLKRWRDPGVAETATVDLGPFAPGILRGGWSSPGSPQTFTPATLYEKIDGQAEQYLKFEFQRLTVIALEHAKEGIGLDFFLYDQRTFANSLGVYEEQRGEKPVQMLGDVAYTPHALGAIGTSGRLFFHITGTRSGPALESKTRDLLEAIGELVQPGETPEPYRVFAATLGIPFEQIAYEPRNVFQFRFAKEFWFARPDPEADARYFVHVAESPEAAETLFRRLHEAQIEEYEGLEATDQAALYRHPFLETYFALHRSGPYVFGIEHHPERDTIAAAIVRLRDALIPE